MGPGSIRRRIIEARLMCTRPSPGDLYTERVLYIYFLDDDLPRVLSLSVCVVYPHLTMLAVSQWSSKA